MMNHLRLLGKKTAIRNLRSYLYLFIYPGRLLFHPFSGEREVNRRVVYYSPSWPALETGLCEAVHSHP
jgi:hypothetical protein